MKKPYIKKIATISKFSVWLVDGKYIRDNLEEEFTNFGQSYDYKFIPKNEFWIDHERVPGEEEFYIDNLLIENKLIFQGLSHKEASKKADLFEKKERKKIDFIKKGIKLNYRNREYIKKIHKKFLKSYSKNIKVWIVDGELVRDLFFIEFTEGGHDNIYHFIPKGEVWIDDDVSKREIKFILLHELHERNLMSKGWNYQKAHRDSSHIEFFCRHHQKELNKKLKEELEKSY